MVFGLAAGAAAAIRGRLLPGATLAARYALRAGITLLGARLTVTQLVETGAGSVLAIVAVVSAALVIGTWLARRLGLTPPMSALITVGMAICGNSAILALSPIIGARHRDTAYAVSTITLFGLLGVLLLPVLGRELGLGEEAFGVWAALAVNDTVQVVATGYAFSPGAGDVATIVKLTRNIAILPVLLGTTWLVTRGAAADDGGARPRSRSWAGLIGRAIPWFVVGFVAFAALRSAGALSVALPAGGTLADLCSTLAGFLILVALAGVGLTTDLRSLRDVGGRPLLLGAAMWVVIGLLALVVATAATAAAARSLYPI